MSCNIAFEGGGGKGAAYLQVAYYLEQPAVKALLNGFSGSSAGALTALALAIGIPAKDLEKFTMYGGFDRTLIEGEGSSNDTGPFIRSVIQFSDIDIRSGKIQLPEFYDSFFVKNRNKFQAVNAAINIADETLAGILAGSPFLPFKILGAVVQNYQPLEKLRDNLLGRTGSMKKYLNKNTFGNLTATGGLFRGDRLVDSLYEGLASFAQRIDLPFDIRNALNRIYSKQSDLLEFVISGNSIRLNNSRVEQNLVPTPVIPYLSAATAVNAGSEVGKLEEGERSVVVRFRDSYNDLLTFQELYNRTGKDLFVTGSNLMDGKTYYFSRFTTPTFPVLEAVAISMHIPVVWAPVFVSYKYNNIDYTGFYVDGGLFNNFPIRIFTSRNSAIGELDLLKVPLVDEFAKSIGFVLDSRASYLSANFPSGLGVPGAAGFSVLDKSTFDQYFNSEKENHVCIIDSGKLSVMNFSPDKKILADVFAKNNDHIFKFLQKHLPVKKLPF